MVASLGDGASTNSIDDILSSDFLFVAGSNTPATHPVIATFFHEAVSGGAALAVVDPRRTELARIAQYVVRPRPGTDAALFGGLAALILERNLYDKRFVPEQTEGIEALREDLRGVTPEVTERETGVPAAVVVDLAESLGRARRPSFYWGMGLAQHSHGTLTVHALINLGLLVGAVGRRGVEPIRFAARTTSRGRATWVPFRPSSPVTAAQPIPRVGRSSRRHGAFPSPRSPG